MSYNWCWTRNRAANTTTQGEGRHVEGRDGAADRSPAVAVLSVDPAPDAADDRPADQDRQPENTAAQNSDIQIPSRNSPWPPRRTRRSARKPTPMKPDTAGWTGLHAGPAAVAGISAATISAVMIAGSRPNMEETGTNTTTGGDGRSVRRRRPSLSQQGLPAGLVVRQDQRWVFRSAGCRSPWRRSPTCPAGRARSVRPDSMPGIRR